MPYEALIKILPTYVTLDQKTVHKGQFFLN